MKNPDEAKRMNQDESFQSAEDLEKENQFINMIKKIKLKAIAREFALKTRSRMQKHLSHFHYRLLNEYQESSSHSSKQAIRDRLHQHSLPTNNLRELLMPKAENCLQVLLKHFNKCTNQFAQLF